MLTQTPRSPSAPGSLPIIAAAAQRSTLIVPSRLTAITLAKSSSGVAAPLRISLVGVAMPAQSTAIRSGPSSVAAPIASSTEAASATSAPT